MRLSLLNEFYFEPSSPLGKKQELYKLHKTLSKMEDKYQSLRKSLVSAQERLRTNRNDPYSLETCLKLQEELSKLKNSSVEIQLKIANLENEL